MTDKYLGEDLIFIISMPRSGSTLLQRVLGGHPDVGTSSEPWIMLHQAFARTHRGIFTQYGADWAALGVNEFVSNYTDGDATYDDAVRAFARTLYGNAMQRQGVSRFIDKTPRYVLIIDDLLRWFPAAKFIFLRRNPLSVLASIVRTQIGHDLTTLERFTNELLIGPRAILSGLDTLGDRAIDVAYEDFVTNPENELERICARLDIDFRPEMLDYSSSPELKGFMQDRTGVTQHGRPVGERAHSWKKVLHDAQQLEFARGYLAELGDDVINGLGYDFEELNDTVRQASERVRGDGYVLPWRVAILSPEDKRGRDQLEVDRYRNIRDHGPLLGRLLTLKNFVRGFFRAMRFTFGRAPRKSELDSHKELAEVALADKNPGREAP